MDIAAALGKLGIDRDDHRVLGLLPLVHIAWADGTVQRAERELIIATARVMKWLDGEADIMHCAHVLVRLLAFDENYAEARKMTARARRDSL